MSSWPKDGKPKAAQSNPFDRELEAGNIALDQGRPVKGFGPELADNAEPIECSAQVVDQADCIIQLFAAACDIAERDDIHQAAERLTLVLDWIRREAALAAADPIFRLLRLAS